MNRPPRPSPPDVAGLLAALRQAETEICRGNWDDQIAVCVLYRYLCRQLIRQNTVLAHSQLPTRLSRRITVEQHAIIAFRLLGFVREYAANL